MRLPLACNGCPPGVATENYLALTRGALLQEPVCEHQGRRATLVERADAAIRHEGSAVF